MSETEKKPVRIFNNYEDLAVFAPQLEAPSEPYDRAIWSVIPDDERDGMSNMILETDERYISPKLSSNMAPYFSQHFHHAEMLLPPGWLYMMSRTTPVGRYKLCYKVICFRADDADAINIRPTWGVSAAIALTGAALWARWTLQEEARIASEKAAAKAKVAEDVSGG